MPGAWNADSEDSIWSELFEVYRHRTYDATALPSIKPTIAEALAEPGQLTSPSMATTRTGPAHTDEEILDVFDEVPELDALRRWSMVLRNLYPRDYSKFQLTPVGTSSTTTSWCCTCRATRTSSHAPSRPSSRE